MIPVNQALHDAAVSHAVDLTHYSNGVVSRMIALLNRMDAKLYAALTSALELLPVESFTVERLDALLTSVRLLNAQAYSELTRMLTAKLSDFVTYESDYQRKEMLRALPLPVRFTIGVAEVNVQQLYGAVMARPFQGRLLKEWAASIEANRMARIRDAIRIGYVSGTPDADIVRTVRGTRAKGFADGIVEIDRREAEAVIRTAISHTAGFVRDRFVKENGSLIRAVSWTSTLDTRTTEICQLRDGKHYTPEGHQPIGHKLPWLSGPGAAHWNCRSVSVPITVSYKELGIDIEEMTPTERASMDGQVPAETTYAQWLQKQSAARQDQVLGPTRGKLMRDGGLTLDKFANQKGKMYTLEQLREQDSAAFTKAGL